MKHSDSMEAYRNIFTVREENRVPGFDPIRFIKMTANGPMLDVGAKKVWFRLKYPEGRIILRPLNITQQIALIEARVFLHKTDTAPAFTSTVQKMLDEVPSGLYVQAAQNEAIDQVLNEAGFTILRKGESVQQTTAQPVVQQTTQKAVTPTVTEPLREAVVEAPATQSVAKGAPIAEAVVEQVKKVEPESVPTQTVAVSETKPTPEHHAKILTMLESPQAETVSESVSEAVPYTTSTPIEEICAKMTVQEALDYIVPSGTCAGWPMSQVLSRRPASMKFYASTGYTGDDNILRAAAKILLAETEKILAS